MKLFSEALTAKLEPLGRNVFLVTGHTFLAELGYLQKLYSFLRYHGFRVYVFDRIPPEPSDTVVQCGAQKLGENGCEVLLAVGGGSVMDAAKGIAILAANGGRIYDYKNAVQFTTPPLPVVAVPTTCGSGSEATRYAVISNTEPKEKFTIKSEQIVPRDFLLDPELLISLPKHELLITAFDASSHLVEVILFNMASAEASVDESLHHLATIIEILDRAETTRDVGVLAELQRAAHAAGRMIHRERTGLPHTIGNKISGFLPFKHGLINALTIPPVLAYVEQKTEPDGRFESRYQRFLDMMRRLGFSQPAVSEALAEFYGSFRLDVDSPDIGSLSQPQKQVVVEQTAGDTALFQITPRGLALKEFMPILDQIVHAIQD